jgi:hypothetical protein
LGYRSFCGVLVVAALELLLVTGGGVADASRLVGAGCKPNAYDYSGVETAAATSGIRTDLTVVSTPEVKAGHVAGWVGVGGPGLGPSGTDEWVQIGYAGFDTGEDQIYYEDALPNKPPQYHTVVASVEPGAKNWMGVLESAQTKGSWQLWLNNKPVSPVIALPSSHGKFAPQAIGENWSGGTSQCNTYEYAFGSVQVASRPGGSWITGKAGQTWGDAHEKATKTGIGSFTARATASASVTAADAEPPILGHGHLASELIGHKVDTRCVHQSQPARAQPNTLLLSNTTCAVLLGYAVAQPHAPKAGTTTALQIAKTALRVLRVVAQESGAGPANADCRAVGLFYRAFRGLGATSGEALALRSALLAARSQISPPLSLSSGCTIR